MSQALYVHIPYCKQLCPYCSFSKYKIGKTIPPHEYVQLLFLEIKHMLHLTKNPYSIYLGGGTPSMIGAENIKLILEKLDPCDEITVEIDPGTVTKEDIDILVDAKVSRFSLGVQSMDDVFLKKMGRTHSEKDTLELVDILNNKNINFSMDLLFALPDQTLHHLQTDIKKMLACKPKHISSYLLEIPSRHKLGHNRASEKEQVEMIETINQMLSEENLNRYEISNYAKRGFESKHNLSYWNDLSYIGLGLSAHSYIKEIGWGMRFWNTKSMQQYSKQVRKDYMYRKTEVLTKAESLTDYCHFSLRKLEGLSCNALKDKYGIETYKVFMDRANLLCDRGYITIDEKISLSKKGLLFFNRVLENLLFTDEDLS